MAFELINTTIRVEGNDEDIIFSNLTINQQLADVNTFNFTWRQPEGEVSLSAHVSFYADNLSKEIAAPLATAGQIIFGSFGFSFILIGTAISMFGNISGMTLNVPRSLFAVSRDNVLSVTIFQKVHKKYATPYAAILGFSTLGFLFAVFGGFRALAVFSVAGALLSYMAVSLAVLKFRRMPGMKNKGFTIPGGYVVPVLSLAICLFFLYHLKANEMISVVVFLVVATILYWGLKLLKTTEKSRRLTVVRGS